MYYYEELESGLVKFNVVVENTSEDRIEVFVPTVENQNTTENRKDFFVSPVLEDGFVNPGSVGVFSVVADMKNRIVSMKRESDYISNPANLTVFQFGDGSSRASYFSGEITR